ncbi:MAG: zinc-binding dehydrogenase [Cyclobacteriaceae bacterium]|nr:zinc-binding dehydrogenase [Cyclobacteriaceae bacterium]
MRAVLCKNFGLPDSLVLEEVPPPSCGPDEVVITVKACGINFPDVLIIQNKYQFKPTLPFSPGGEVAGVVKTAGEKVKQLKPDDRVVALCGWGGLAEEVVVKANRVFPMPPAMDFITASSTLYTYGTSFHALKDRAVLKAGETLLVLGAAGGVGLAAVELSKVMGATVIAAASSDEKLEICKEKGADFTINYTNEDLRERIKQITQEKGVDVVYDPVGGALAEAALRSMAWRGRYLVVGFAAGNIPQFPANLPLLKGCSIVGVFWGSFAERQPQDSLQNFGQLLAWINEGKIKQHIHNVYSLEQAKNALQDLMQRKVRGKAVVKIGDWQEQTVSLAIQEQAEKPKPVSVSKPLVIKRSEIKKYVGQALGVSDWLTVTQEMINNFANATHDYQWIHVDTEKAKTLLPGGKTIAHGYLTLSLASKFFYELLTIEGAATSINYGLNKARFPVAVKSGDRIRMTGRIASVEDMPGGGTKVFLECMMELEGQEKLAYIGELITAIY